MKVSTEICTVKYVAIDHFVTEYTVAHCGGTVDPTNITNVVITDNQVPKRQRTSIRPGAEFLSKRTWEQRDFEAYFHEMITFSPDEISIFKEELEQDKEAA